MTLLIAALFVPPALWAVDRLFNGGEFVALLREELNLAPESRLKAPKRPRITVARR
jgi:hypothetical protein